MEKVSLRTFNLTQKHMQCVNQNMGKTPVKNQYRKLFYLYTITLSPSYNL